jgi:putative NIF3 family GTP cyclohydrolase 1 type 2
MHRYPEALADKSFDNTGCRLNDPAFIVHQLEQTNPFSLVLLEAPFEPSRRQKNSVLLAIDLTTAVADEAIRRQDSAIVAYRMSPIHFPVDIP